MEFLEPRSDINSNNLSPVVNVVSVFLLILIILAVITRFATKTFRTKNFEVEDGLICAAVVSISSADAPASIANYRAQGVRNRPSCDGPRPKQEWPRAASTDINI